ncbi:MAG TPA: hypothetical protein PKG52_04480 [bacterium]|nr:hypothetical protein [bacterium]HPS29267.1 hypothetical protein [bacterium]
MKVSLAAFLTAALIIFSNICLEAKLLFDDKVPQDLRNEVSKLYDESKLTNNFLIEMQSEKTLLIVFENGFVKELPVDQITAADILNVMIDMIDTVIILKKAKATAKDTKTELSKVKVFESEKVDNKEQTFIKGGLTVAKNVQFFPWVDSSKRFGLSFYASSEENWAGGINLNAGLAFLKIGLDFKKGADIEFKNDMKVPWEGYGVFISFDLFTAYDFFLTAGFEVVLYSTKGRLFEREFFVFKTSYKINWFEASVGINVSPSIIELGLFGTKYSMERYHFLFLLGFMF